MLRHHAGDLRVMMAGRVKTASEDGKAMHAPMLAAVREKRNWKFDGGGAWRELFRMKPSQLPLIAVALLLAGMVFIVFDRSQPVKSAHGSAAPGTVGAAIAQSTTAKPVMVEFYADWCGPCKVVGPQVEEFAKEVASKARVIRVNVDEDSRLGQQHGVRGIPAFIVFKNGQETARDVGAISKERMRELLAE
jgi:thioredoxin